MAKKRQSRVPLHERAVLHGDLAATVWGKRERLGLRQEELADLAGCSPRFVHELEAGKTTVQLHKLVDVLNALGLHLEIVKGASTNVETGSSVRTDLDLDGIDRASRD